ncbi:MAG TPA: class I SAM-dependent methyltransferase [Thermoflexales bacterium]|jgi:SAM-dependent methyltransferase|nr:class I SAM-dependent methyltransferase [Thermoflexales bacterium]HQX09715.1 class I SAM-dependent methyltransferase [Thermoflexales bacterium]HQY24050.1 class I SAM-dependent methyltransferase [Thermoflexales bacterium]HQZ53060.1 class I SAM-dependent methyltransferase [Thermoflexales bacterium]HRA52528.1 class I SAM-dependent methyltransferase [Thermoflexales bacterium]
MIYDTTAPFYDLFDADDPGALWHREFVLARTKGIDAVMDVGAGTGRTAMALAERGLRVWAVEPSRGMRGVMLARLGDDTSLDERLTIVPGDAQTCDLGRSFPLIVFSHALYLLDGSAARVAALANLAGHLAPGGRLIVDFALEEGRAERPRALAAERRIGEAVYRRFSESIRGGDRLWAVTWAFEVEIAGQVVERAEDTFRISTATLAECRASLAAAGLRPVAEFADYSGRALGDPADASRYVSETARIAG